MAYPAMYRINGEPRYFRSNYAQFALLGPQLSQRTLMLSGGAGFEGRICVGFSSILDRCCCLSTSIPFIFICTSTCSFLKGFFISTASPGGFDSTLSGGKFHIRIFDKAPKLSVFNVDIQPKGMALIQYSLLIKFLIILKPVLHGDFQEELAKSDCEDEMLTRNPQEPFS